MDNLNRGIKAIVAAKAERRRELAALSYPCKVKIVVDLQRMVEPILRARGLERHSWTGSADEAPLFADVNNRHL